MTIRSILLHADATERCAVRVAVARDLAERCDATVTALYAATPSALQGVQAMGEGSSMMFLANQDIDNERRERARRIFDACQAGPRFSWAELDDASTIAGFVRPSQRRMTNFSPT